MAFSAIIQHMYTIQRLLQANFEFEWIVFYFALNSSCCLFISLENDGPVIYKLNGVLVEYEIPSSRIRMN